MRNLIKNITKIQKDNKAKQDNKTNGQNTINKEKLGENINKENDDTNKIYITNTDNNDINLTKGNNKKKEKNKTLKKSKKIKEEPIYEIILIIIFYIGTKEQTSFKNLK